jgi:hypothetical protein
MDNVSGNHEGCQDYDLYNLPVNVILLPQIQLRSDAEWVRDMHQSLPVAVLVTNVALLP